MPRKTGRRPVPPSRAERALLVSVGRRVREYREASGQTQAQFGARLSTTQSAVMRMEAGRQNLTLRSLARVALALGVPPVVLLREDPT